MHCKKKMKKNGAERPGTNGQNLHQSVLKCREQRFDSGATGLDDTKSNGARKIEQSIAYMMEHLDKPLQVAALAAAANVSASHFFVLFKRCTGCPPIDYFTRLRMQRARQLLEAGSLHVKEVAAALGYDDPFYFSRVFKSINRIAPSKYRLKQKQPNGASLGRHILPTLFPFVSDGHNSGRINFQNISAAQ
jgi:transcriptional regulator GlxA family with amidase domain